MKQRFANAWTFESANVFGATLPDLEDGNCPAKLAPVYRLYNNRSDVNHRYTTSRYIRDEMKVNGWVPEGFGPLGVALCAS